MKQKAGFTLIEILVVIILVGVLMTLGTSAYINAQRHGRNTRRTGDLKTIQESLEHYFIDNAGYPAGCNPGSTYLPQGFPRDPRTGAAYTFASCTASTYCACVQLEATTTGGNSTVNNCSNYAPGSYYCVQNLN